MLLNASDVLFTSPLLNTSAAAILASSALRLQAGGGGYGNYNCSSEPAPRPLTVSEVDFFVQHYIFPVQFILGLLGNAINLTGGL